MRASAFPASLTRACAQYYSDSGYAIIYTPEHPEGVVVTDPMADCLPGMREVPAPSYSAVADHDAPRSSGCVLVRMQTGSAQVLGTKDPS